jgi:cellulose synthase/poly-beta-1,6-N-acetylglucosamine synthase-like glycosyltransferase
VHSALAASFLLGGCLLGLALRTEGRRRRAPRLPPPASSPGDVTVLLPVRDEEQNVAPCVETLLAQTAEPLVHVIDDGSTDATAALVSRRAEGEPRLTLVEAGPLAPGWRGKLHALWVGSRGVDTPWLLLTDADTRHHPEALARARAAAEAGGLDAVSLAGLQEARGAGENLLVPTVFALLDALLGSWEAAAAGAGPAVANGQFILLRREAWERAGGFPAVRAAPLDDVAIARRLRETGGRTAFFRAPDLLRVRMYRGAREAVLGWRRNLGGLFGGHRGQRGQPGTVLSALAVLLAPPLVLAAELLTGQWPAAGLLWAAGATASALLRSGSGHTPAWGLLFPCDTLVLAAVLALSELDRRRGRLMSWKGREMEV